MNDVLKAINARLKVLGAETGRLFKAKELLERDTEPVTGITVPKQDSAMDKPMTARRRTKKHRTRAGLLKGRILTLLRMNRGTVKELVKQLEAASFPFAFGTNHTGCVRACVVVNKNKGILTSTHVPGRGEVYSLVLHGTHLAGALAVKTAPSSLTTLKSGKSVQTRASQYGLTDRIIKVLAEAGVTGKGLTANQIIANMTINGFRFTAKAPLKSVTGLLSGLLKKGMVSRYVPVMGKAFAYKIRTTTELLDAVRKDA